MRFIDYLIEADEQIGVVVSTRNGKFYDIDFVEYNSLRGLEGHHKNLGEYFINTVRENEAWEEVFPFFSQMSSVQGKRLGEEYSSEDADFFLFGPFSAQQLGAMDDAFTQATGR